MEGKRIVLIDDSIVRGNTMSALVKVLREAGAKEVRVWIAKILLFISNLKPFLVKKKYSRFIYA